MNKLFLFTIFLVGCTTDSERIDALKSYGFTDIQLTGYEFFGCSKEETGTSFIAKNSNERKVSGIVCCGNFGSGKGCTVRF